MKYDLVFEGGGAKGMVFVGACEEFFQRGHTFGRLLGTSAGAITAALLAAGYTPQEMLAALKERENGKSVFAGFMGDPPPFTRDEIRTSAIRTLLQNIDIKIVPHFLEDKLDDGIAQMLAENSRTRNFFALVERGGWYAADRFISWLEDKLDSCPLKTGQRRFSGLTLSQFYAEAHVELTVVASDATDCRILVLNQHTAPDCPVVWAIRMSMSIPLVWNEVIWEEKWGAYLGRNITGHAVVDGGLLSNFPIELFISNEPQVTRLMGPKRDNAVLGLLIDETLSVPQSVSKGLFIDINIKPSELRTVQRISRLINTATTAHDKMVMEEFNHLVVRLPAGGYGTTEFDMSDDRRDALVDAGRNAMRLYLDNPPGLSAVPKGIKGVKTVADRIANRLLEQ
ncbi:MAG: patatin-like phospholipase family protein [Thermodesulfovibrionales bacterium]|jgi:predicted acylesterase/phospholipase RssA